MYEPYEYAKLLVVFSSGFFASFVSLPAVMKKTKNLGIVGTDVHKKDRPIIPEMGGIAVLIGLAFSMFAAYLLFPTKIVVLVSFLAVILIAATVGTLDDLKTLSPKLKPFLTLFAGLPILIFGTYDPHLTLPIVGLTRLTIIYPLMIPIAIAVTSNAVNMMDPFNGVMSSTCSIVTLIMLVSAILLQRTDAIIVCVGLLGSILAFYYFNKYPSKVFSGDVGSLSIGAALGAAAIIGRIEIIAVVAFMPQIMNAFFGLSTIGRLYERREVPRPVQILDDGRLTASEDTKAPITLARMILARGPLTEKEAAQLFLVLSVISGVLAIFTMFLLV